MRSLFLEAPEAETALIEDIAAGGTAHLETRASWTRWEGSPPAGGQKRTEETPCS